MASEVEAMQATFPEHQFMQLASGRCHYRLYGTPSERPLVVLVHGINAGLFVFQELAESLTTAGHCVLTYDMYGRGHSDLTAFPHKVELFVTQLAELLLALGPATQFASSRPINLMGVSMGGAVVTVFATIFPQLVHRLGLVAPAGLPVEMPLIAKLARLPGVGEAVVALAAKNGKLADAAKHAYADPENEENARHLARMQLYTRQQLLFNPGYCKAMLSTVRNFPLSTLEPIFSRLGRDTTMPIQLLWGDQDAVVPYMNHVRILQLIPRVQFTCIEACGHTDMLAKHKDLFRKVMLDFFAPEELPEQRPATTEST